MGLPSQVFVITIIVGAGATFYLVAVVPLQVIVCVAFRYADRPCDQLSEGGMSEEAGSECRQ